MFSISCIDSVLSAFGMDVWSLAQVSGLGGPESAETDERNVRPKEAQSDESELGVSARHRAYNDCRFASSGGRGLAAFASSKLQSDVERTPLSSNSNNPEISCIRNHSRQHARDRAVRARVPVMCPRRPASHAGGPRGRLARKQVQRTPFATHRTVHHPHGRAILVLTNHACHHARSQCHMLKGPSVSRVVLRGCCRAHRSSAVLYT